MSTEATPSAPPVAPAAAAPSGEAEPKPSAALPPAVEAKRPTPAPGEGEPAAKKSKTAEELTPEALKSLGIRPYLEKTVVPVLMQGMQHIVKERPDDPCDALAKYLTEHNPRRKAAVAGQDKAA